MKKRGAKAIQKPWPLILFNQGAHKRRSLFWLWVVLVLSAAFLVDVSRSQNDNEDNDDSKEQEGAEDEQPFVCPTNSGNHADPKTCRRFYICSTDGAAHRSFCPNGLYWDDEKKICTYKNEAKCGPLKNVKKKPIVIEVDPCNENQCQLPFCYCSRDGDIGPLDEEPQYLPQLMMLTFDGAVNLNNFPKYKTLLGMKHGNGSNACPIRGTFFVKNDYNDYSMIQELYYLGNEMAVEGVTGRSLQYENLTIWKEELEGMRDLLEKLANVPAKDILGIRAPSLKPGFNDQYQALIESNFFWDSSISTKTTDKPIWPYTLDYAIPHECKIKSCPTKAFPGVWEIPVNLHYVSGLAGGQCSYLDQCVFALQGADDVFDWLKEDFQRHYNGNRAPYAIPFHTNWFTHKHQVEGLLKFVEWSLQLPDVYYVTATEALLWMLEPSEALLKEVTGTCNYQDRPKPCNKPKTCELPHKELDGTNTLRYLTTCNPCPLKYPTIPSLESEEDDK